MNALLSSDLYTFSYMFNTKICTPRCTFWFCICNVYGCVYAVRVRIVIVCVCVFVFDAMQVSVRAIS